MGPILLTLPPLLGERPTRSGGLGRNDRKPPPPPKAQPLAATQPPQAEAALVLCHLPLPPTPPIPYPTPMHTHTRPATIVVPAKAGTPPPRASDSLRRPNVVGLRGWPPALFPFVEIPPFSARALAHLRPAPSQIRFVSLCRLFPRPPAGPSAPRPARAWQIRLVSLCPLVHRASNPSWTAFPQARAAGKSRTHDSAQLKPNLPPSLTSLSKSGWPPALANSTASATLSCAFQE